MPWSRRAKKSFGSFAKRTTKQVGLKIEVNLIRCSIQLQNNDLCRVYFGLHHLNVHVLNPLHITPSCFINKHSDTGEKR